MRITRFIGFGMLSVMFMISSALANDVQIEPLALDASIVPQLGINLPVLKFNATADADRMLKEIVVKHTGVARSADVS